MIDFQPECGIFNASGSSLALFGLDPIADALLRKGRVAPECPVLEKVSETYSEVAVRAEVRVERTRLLYAM